MWIDYSIVKNTVNILKDANLNHLRPYYEIIKLNNWSKQYYYNTIDHQNVSSNLAKTFLQKLFVHRKCFRFKLIKLDIIMFTYSSVIDKADVFYYIFLAKVVGMLSL